jgi:hypothetical protein
MMGTLGSFTHQHRRQTPLTERASRARLPPRADASDGRLNSRLACADGRAGKMKPACRQTRQGVAPPRGGGGFKSLGRRRSRTARVPRADFFSATRVLKTLGKSKNNQRAGLNIEITALLDAFSRGMRELPAGIGDYFPPPVVGAGACRPADARTTPDTAGGGFSKKCREIQGGG